MLVFRNAPEANVDNDNMLVQSGPIYDLIFKDNNVNDEKVDASVETGDNNRDDDAEATDIHLNNDDSDVANTSNNSVDSFISEQGVQQQPHVHQWYKVVDCESWIEYKQVRIGIQYRCNHCGYTTSYASSISSHCSRTSHSFSQIPIHETRATHHEEISHLECDCGARS